MTMLHIDNLTSGMILKDSVCDRSGRLLLPADTELNDKHLKIFRTWGITEVDICRTFEDEQSLPESAATCSQQCDDAVEAVLARLFSRNDQKHPMIHELMRICRERRICREH